MKTFMIFISVALAIFGPGDASLLGDVVGTVKSAATDLANLGLPQKFIDHLTKFGIANIVASLTAEARDKLLAAFEENDKRITEINLENEKKGIDFRLAHNNFSTISPADFIRDRMGTVVPSSVLQFLQRASSSESANSRRKRAAVTPPASADWRNTGAVTAVKDQGQCGSCWSFSANGAIVGAWYAKYKKSINLSEQNLVDCVTKNCYGCNGGWMVDAYNWVTSNGGIDSDPAYGPYAAANKTCRYTVASKVANVTSAAYVTPQNDEVALAAAVAKQPIATAIDASLLQNYKQGFYSCTGNVTLNHGVLLVGYGNVNGTDCWIVKNSWGASWGYQGYFYIKRNANNTCGVASVANYPLV